MHRFLVSAFALALFATAAVAQDWRPSSAQEASAREALVGVITDMQKAEYLKLYAKLTPAMQARIPEDRFLRQQESSDGQHGRRAQWRITAVVWYPPSSNPPAMVAEFSVVTQREAEMCGFIVFAEQADGSFLMNRLESNAIPGGISPEQRLAMQAALEGFPGCGGSPSG
ncbi:MAG: hypothetical protein AAFQ36_10060 [Pseudomonadota bacterium]